MTVGSYPGRTDCTHRVARAAIQLPAKTTPSGPGAKRVQAGRHRDEFPRGQGPWPKAGPPYPKRRAQTPKVLARENTFGFSAISSREPDFRVPYSICQHALTPENADWPAVDTEIATLAEQRIHYVEKLVELAGVDSNNKPQVAEAHQFLAEAVVAIDLSDAYHQNISYLHEAGAKEGGVPSLMRSISDHTFRDNRSGIGQMMATMLDSKHQEQAEHAYQVLHNMQEQMVAIAYAYHQTGDRLDWSAQPADAVKLREFRQMLEYDLTDPKIVQTLDDFRSRIPEATEPLNSADHLRELLKERSHRILDSLQNAVTVRAEATEKAIEQYGAHHIAYELGEVSQINQLVQGNHIEQCVTTAQQDANWRPFLTGQTNFHRCKNG